MESKASKVRAKLVRKQQTIFLAMLAVGAGLVAASLLLDREMIGQGIAFILVGFAGMLMSWTTFDIGAGIKEAIHEVGRENQKALDSLSESQKQISESVDRMSESVDRMSESVDRMSESQERMSESQKQISESQERMSKTIDRISKSQDSTAKLLERLVKDTERA